MDPLCIHFLNSRIFPTGFVSPVSGTKAFLFVCLFVVVVCLFVSFVFLAPPP